MTNTNFKTVTAKPIIKWAGGKRQLLPQIKEMLPESYGRYYEPFIGGGALFLDLQPEDAVINDFNSQLTNLYIQVRDKCPALEASLAQMQDRYNSMPSQDAKRAFYNRVLADFNENMVQKLHSLHSAAQFIFLNKTGFNGVYRVNRKGMLNTAFGKKDTANLFESGNLQAVSTVLANTRICTGDFADACKDAESGDFVFFDSPYYDTFDTYQAGGFCEADHIRLANVKHFFTS